jgi:hypothetical protein
VSERRWDGTWGIHPKAHTVADSELGLIEVSNFKPIKPACLLPSLQVPDQGNVGSAYTSGIHSEAGELERVGRWPLSDDVELSLRELF